MLALPPLEAVTMLALDATVAFAQCHARSVAVLSVCVRQVGFRVLHGSCFACAAS